jgi:hypothetical protein
MSGYCKVSHDNIELRSWFRDDAHTYHVGDKVDCRLRFDQPGEWIDGVHEAETEDDPPKRYWVVIKNQIIVGVREAIADACSVRLLYEIPAQPPREWWPEMAWEAQAWRKQLRDKAVESRRAAAREAAIRKWADWPPTDPHRIQALKEAEIVDAVNEFTRTKMRESGFYRMIMGPWDVLLDLTAEATAFCKNWRSWGVPEPMLSDAARYKTERHLRDIKLWDTTKFLSIVPVLVNGELHDVEVQELRDERRPKE